MTTAIHWFRRDLRLGDNPALVAAAEADEVVALFVIDDRLWAPAGNVRRRALVACLDSLDASIGGRLVVRTGDPVDVVPEIAAEVDADVYCAADFGPYGSTRDEAVAEALDDAGHTLHRIGSPYAVDPGTIFTKSGDTPYKVFTPFRRVWEDHGWPEPVDAPTVTWSSAVTSDERPDAPDDDGAELPVLSEEAAWKRADEFLDERLQSYDDDRDRPDLDRTSRLSADLKWGLLHPRQLLHRLDDSGGAATFRSELGWREFYADVLFHRPETVWESMNERAAKVALDTGDEADERFEAWAAGTTGYPIIDAGMRQLLAEGWMHNRVRMLVASFLVKDLHLPWQRGAAHFMAHLVDADLASNQHGWQWTAGTGTDAAPYFRIFNPTSQAKKFDPDGDYVRRYVSELTPTATKYIHEPWRDPDGQPLGYPPPIIDHGDERAEALRRYEDT